MLNDPNYENSVTMPTESTLPRCHEDHNSFDLQNYNYIMAKRKGMKLSTYIYRLVI